MKRSPLLVYLFWNGFIAYGVWKLAWRIREVQLYEHLSDPISPVVAVPAFFLWFLCFPYVQGHINRLVEVNNGAREIGHVRD